jgi:transposase
MNYYGIDIHKRYSVYTKVNEKGMVLAQGKIPNNKEAFRKVMDQPVTETKAVIEATGNWYYLHDLLVDMVGEVVVAHPLKTKAIASARIKTDKIDATTLAHLLRTDFIPRSYIAPPEVRNLRELLRYRISLVRISTRLKNKIHAILIKNGLQQPYSDLFGKKGRVWLENLNLNSVHGMATRGYLHVLDVVNEEIKLVSRGIDLQAKADPRAVFLESIPGIGHYSAMLILSEIGDVFRFPTANHLVSYAGLNPSVHSSGGVTHYGRIAKQGSSYLRWVMVEVAAIAARYSQRLGGYHARIAHKHGSKIANVALAREILAISYYLLKKGEPFKEYTE